MQQASQASQKMEGHKDKIINQVAMITKQRFFNEEIRYLTEFKERLEALNQLAKPSDNPSLQISKIQKKIGKQFVSDLQDEILFTRREISLEEINNDLRFQTKIAQIYEQKIEQFGHKLEHMESIVQQSEERRKNKEKADFSNSSYTFKTLQTRKTIEDFLKQKQKIKGILRHRLVLSGKIMTLQVKQKNQLTKSKQSGHKYSDYHFLTKHKEHYRNKSRDRGLLEHESTIFQSQKIKYVRYPIRRSFLQVFQNQIFDEEYQKIAAYNRKMQVQIELLKQAATEQENARLLQELHKRNNLEREQRIFREIFAFQKMSRRFQEKLQKCSYKWVFQAKDVSTKVESKQQEWESERLLANRNNRLIRVKHKSADKKYASQTSSFSPAEANKSNIKTNCSIQVLQN